MHSIWPGTTDEPDLGTPSVLAHQPRRFLPASDLAYLRGSFADMAIQWSTVHANLGLAPQPLTYAHIEAAVAAKMPETEDVDWKGTLPGTSAEEKAELCKDVAAMANTKGGLLVYGVTEERGTGRAQQIQPVDLAETQSRRLRALAAAIRPLVPGIELVAMEGGTSGEGVLVMQVPASVDAPHVVGERTHLGVPFRVGPDTAWMNEREIERAYGDRFRRREEEASRLRGLVDGVTDSLDPDRAWLIGAATPRTPLSAVARPVAKEQIADIMQRSLAVAYPVLGAPNRPTLIQELGDAARNPRVGLRRWIMQASANQGPDRLADFVYVELHHDGAVIVAAALDGWWRSPLEGKVAVPVPLTEWFIVDFLSLVQTFARANGQGGPAACRLDIRRPDESVLLAAVDNEYVGGYVLNTMTQPSWSRSVRRFVPVETEMNPADEMFDTNVVSQLAKDVLAQFGLSELRVIPVPKQSP